MSQLTNDQDLGFIYSGLLIPVYVKVENPSGLPINDVVVKLQEIPDGVAYVSSTLGRGEFIITELTWHVGYVGPKQVYDGILTFRVTNPLLSHFSFTFTASESGQCEDCLSQNPICYTYYGISVQNLLDAGVVISYGTYADDADAAADGVSIGQYYTLADPNSYGLPPGQVRKRVT